METPTFITKNKFDVCQLCVPYGVNNHLQLLCEKFAELQKAMPQLKPNFGIDNIRDHQYFVISVWDSGLQSYVKKDGLQNILDYIKSNS